MYRTNLSIRWTKGLLRLITDLGKSLSVLTKCISSYIQVPKISLIRKKVLQSLVKNSIKIQKFLGSVR